VGSGEASGKRQRDFEETNFLKLIQGITLINDVRRFLFFGL